MKFLEPVTQIIQQPEGLDGIYKQIEYVGRSCWMSQHMIKEDSATSFVRSLQENGHTAPFEHGTVYLKCYGSEDELKKYAKNPYSRYVRIYDHKEVCQGDVDYYATEYVTTNYRVIVENNWFDDLQYLVPFDKEHHVPRITFNFICQRAISAEFNRHRHNSPMESSSRYCNFSGDRFGREITICVSDWVIKEAEKSIKPIGFRHIEGIDALNECNKGLAQYCYEVANGYDVANMNKIDYWLFANLACEHAYMNMIRLGAKAEEAREILPLDLKTELYHTAFLDDWLHFCSLRAWKSQGNNPHPEAKRLGIAVFEGLKYLGFVTDDFRKDKEIQ